MANKIKKMCQLERNKARCHRTSCGAALYGIANSARGQ